VNEVKRDREALETIDMVEANIEDLAMVRNKSSGLTRPQA